MRNGVKLSDIWRGRGGAAIVATIVSKGCGSGAGDCSWGGLGSVEELFLTEELESKHYAVWGAKLQNQWSVV